MVHFQAKPLLWVHFFYDHLVYCVANLFILWQFGTFCGHLLNYPHFGILSQEKSGSSAAKSSILFPPIL
jgi:phosphotransferase system  glucose/maltose/N-acetylglucosamine-specific IIC component